MNAPRIRLDEAATDFERELLDSWGAERPPAHARSRALSLVGVGAGLAAGATTATVATGATGAATQVAAPKVATLGLVALGKWIAIGALLGAGVLTAAPYVTQKGAARAVTGAAQSPVAALPAANAPRPTGAHEGSASPVAPSDVPGANLPAGAGAAAEPMPSPIANPVAPTVRGSSPASAARSGLATAPPSTAEEAPAAPVLPPRAEEPASQALGDQVAALNRARSSLAAGDATAALRALDDYDARFPDGVLAEEAAVMRIDALVAMGRREEASDLARRFIAAHPASPYASRVRQSLLP
jgi:hypothetical protein